MLHQPFNGGVAFLHADRKSVQILDRGDAADALVKKNRYFKRRAGFREVVQQRAGFGMEHRIDHVGIAGLHDALGFGPVGGFQPDLDPGFAGP